MLIFSDFASMCYDTITLIRADRSSVFPLRRERKASIAVVPCRRKTPLVAIVVESALDGCIPFGDMCVAKDATFMIARQARYPNMNARARLPLAL